MRSRNRGPCHTWCGTIKILPCSKTVSAVQRYTFCSSFTVDISILLPYSRARLKQYKTIQSGPNFHTRLCLVHSAFKYVIVVDWNFFFSFSCPRIYLIILPLSMTSLRSERRSVPPIHSSSKGWYKTSMVLLVCVFQI